MNARRTTRVATVAAAVLAFALIGGTASAGVFSAWGPPVSAETQIPGTSTELNTPSQDGCPILSPDGLSLFMASNRPGYTGEAVNLDIWVAHRASTSAPWGAPVNVGAPVNSTADDFCPTPIAGGGLFFVSARTVVGACGGPDIYFTRLHHGVWAEPKNLGCQVNSAAGEAGPSLVLEGARPMLYFSSTRPGGSSAEAAGAVSGDSDIYVSPLTKTGFGAATLVEGLNTAANDSRPNVRHDGLEIVFDSDRDATPGLADIYTAARSRVHCAWSVPVGLSAINTAANESRASFSRDATTLVFGSTRAGEGSSDIYVTTRERLSSHH
jgi:hypothetical protein